jgi:hypothetical protein
MFDNAFHALVQEAPLPLAVTLLSTYHVPALAVWQTSHSKKDQMVWRMVRNIIMAHLLQPTFG